MWERHFDRRRQLALRIYSAAYVYAPLRIAVVLLLCPQILHGSIFADVRSHESSLPLPGVNVVVGCSDSDCTMLGQLPEFLLDFSP